VALDSLRVAAHDDGLRADLPRPLLSSLDKTPPHSTTSATLTHDESNNLRSPSRLQDVRRVRLQPAHDPFFQNRDEHELVSLPGDSREATADYVRIGQIAELRRESGDLRRIGKGSLANGHLLSMRLTWG